MVKGIEIMHHLEFIFQRFNRNKMNNNYVQKYINILNLKLSSVFVFLKISSMVRKEFRFLQFDINSMKMIIFIWEIFYYENLPFGRFQ